MTFWIGFALYHTLAGWWMGNYNVKEEGYIELIHIFILVFFSWLVFPFFIYGAYLQNEEFWSKKFFVKEKKK